MHKFVSPRDSWLIDWMGISLSRPLCVRGQLIERYKILNVQIECRAKLKVCYANSIITCLLVHFDWLYIFEMFIIEYKISATYIYNRKCAVRFLISHYCSNGHEMFDACCEIAIKRSGKLRHCVCNCPVQSRFCVQSSRVHHKQICLDKHPCAECI